MGGSGIKVELGEGGGALFNYDDDQIGVVINVVRST